MRRTSWRASTRGFLQMPIELLRAQLQLRANVRAVLLDRLDADLEEVRRALGRFHFSQRGDDLAFPRGKLIEGFEHDVGRTAVRCDAHELVLRDRAELFATIEGLQRLKQLIRR